MLAQASLTEHLCDPEGIAIRPGSHELLVAFDGGAQIVTFSDVPTLSTDPAPLPEGADCMML
ncbi:MAG: hypothetical protein AAF968_02570 [Pseudomonadota bacterium]